MSRDDSDDLESTGLDKSRAIRKVSRELEKQEIEKRIRHEYEEKEQARLEKAVYSTRSRVDKLEAERIVDIEKRIQKLETATAILKWTAGIVVSSIVAMIIAALGGG